MGKLLWLDLETSALDPREGEILEVAFVWAAGEGLWGTGAGDGGTFARVRLPDFRGSYVVRPIAPLVDLDPAVQEMHAASGLLEDVERRGALLADVEREILDVVGDEPRDRDQRLHLAGFSVHFDLAWLRLHMPRLARHLSHRVYDVSSIVRFTEDALGGEVKGRPAHRAMDDVLAAIEADEQCRRLFGLA